MRKNRGLIATDPQQTMKTYLEKWVEQVIKLTRKPNTYKAFRSAVNAHLIPALGYMKLQQLKVKHLQAFFAERQERLKPGTLRVIQSALNSALDNAVKLGLVARNVAKLVDLPHVERYEGQVLTEEQAQRLLEVARGSCLDVLLLVALTTGMRRGELLALHWNDLDDTKGMLQVRRNVSRMPGIGLVEREQKTKAGRRKIALPDVVLVALREHEKAQQQTREKAGERWQEDGLIFSNKYGRFSHPDHMLYQFKKLLKDAGLPVVRFHDLRHSVATILLVAKIDLKVVSELLGHSSIAVTADIYGHVLPEMQREVINKMDDLFKRS